MTATDFTRRAEALIAKLSLGTPVPEIEDDKAYVVQEIRRMLAEARDGRLPPRPERTPRLARLVVDQWPLGHPLANEVGEVEALYRRL